MAINVAGLTWDGKLATDFSEALRDLTFMDKAVNYSHTVVPGIKAKQQIPILGNLGLMGKVQANCKPDESTESAVAREKSWEPEYIEDRIAQCWKDIDQSFMVWAMKEGINKANLEDTDISAYLLDIVSDAARKAISRISYFSDPNHTQVGAGSGTEVITAAGDVPFFTPITGYFAQIFASVTAGDTPRVTISENAEATKALQLDLAAGTARSTFQKMMAAADTRLTDQSDLQILVTKSLFDNYAEWLESQALDASFVRNEAGFMTLRFRGIEVVRMDDWDRTIQAYMDLGTTYSLPNRALLISKSHWLLGTESEGTLGQVEGFYDQTEKKYFIDFGFNLDAKLSLDYMAVAAY
jgi:hypothetical protein